MFFTDSWTKVPAPEVQPALPPVELIEEVIPTAEKALPSVSEEQSLILMIEGVFSELAPEAAANEARDIEEEEEGSSSTPDKDDNEGNEANDEDQINNALN